MIESSNTLMTTQDNKVLMITKSGKELSIERPNINDQAAILSYGLEPQKKICEILESTAQMIVSQNTHFLSDDELKRITSFDESLKKPTQEEKCGLLTRLSKVLKKQGRKSEVTKEEPMDTYKAKYDAYTKNLNQVSANLDDIIQDTLIDIKTRDAIVAKISPIIEYLEALIKVGEEELAIYESQTAKIRSSASTQDDEFMIVCRTQLSNSFLEQLNGLTESVIIYKDAMQKYAIQQGASTVTIQAINRFKTNQKPILQCAASITIFNMQENQRQQSIFKLTNAANEAIKKSAQTMLSNTEQASQIVLNNGIDIPTIERLINATTEAVNIISKTKEEYLQKVQIDKALLDVINKKLEDNKNKILGLIEGSTGTVTALNDDETPSSKQNNNLRKRI